MLNYKFFVWGFVLFECLFSIHVSQIGMNNSASTGVLAKFVDYDDIKIIHVASEAFNINKTQSFVMIGNELYRLLENSIEFVITFVDHISNILNIEACHWQNKFIFVVELSNVYNIYILEVSQISDRLRMLEPIQNIVKHGQFQKCILVNFDGNIYSFLASSFNEENRSELRVLQWKHTFFQEITLLSNRYRIDHMLVQPDRRVIVLINNKFADKHETFIYIYGYNRVVNGTSSEKDLDIYRLQVLSVPFSVNMTATYLLHEYGSIHFHLICCEEHMEQNCEYFVWRNSMATHLESFERTKNAHFLEKFQSNQGDVSRTKGIMFIQSNENILLVENGQNAYNITNDYESISTFIQTCHHTHTIGITLSKIKLAAANIALKMSCLNVCNGKDCNGTPLSIRNYALNGVFSAPNRQNLSEHIQEGIISSTNYKADNVERLIRTAEILSDLKSRLINQQLEYIKPSQANTNRLLKILDVFDFMQTNSVVANNVFANNVIVDGKRPNVLHRIVSTGRTSKKVILELLQKMRAVISKMNARFLTKQFNKRSTKTKLKIKKLFLAANVRNGFEFKKSEMKQSKHFMKGTLLVEVLFVRSLETKCDNLCNVKRTKREHSVTSLKGSKIVAKSINKIKWDEFINRIYRKGSNTPINGNVTLVKLTEIAFLFADVVNGYKVFDLMTIATDQAVHSNVYITEVLTTDVNALIFNDMKQFSKNVALLKDDTRIDSRVKISDCKVKNAMKLSDNEGEDMTEHIVGTHMDDLTQIYNGHVVIKGTTNINNIFVFDTPKNLESQGSRDDSLFNEALSTDQSEPTGIIIDGINLVWRNINHLYWSKTLSQNIDRAIFTKLITSPQAYIDHLDTVSSKEYFTLDKPSMNLPLLVDFQAKVLVHGNVFTHQNATIQNLITDSIGRVKNVRITLGGSIIFKERLLANQVVMQMDFGNIIRKSTEETTVFSTSVMKRFQHHLIISGNIIMKNTNTNITMRNYNGYNSVSNLLNAVVTPRKNGSMCVLFDQLLDGDAIVITNAIDGLTSNNFERIFMQLSQVSHRIRSLQIFDEIIIGSGSTLQVILLNKLELSNYINCIVSKLEDPKKAIEIGGEKSFISEFKIASAHTYELSNQVRTNDWYENAIRHQRTEDNIPQIIDGSGWRFNDITSDNIQATASINGVQNLDKKPTNIIFVDEERISITSDLSLSNFANIGRNSGFSSSHLRPCKMNEIDKEDLNLPQRNWLELNIIGNAKVVLTPDTISYCGLLCFFQTALTSTSNENTNFAIIFKITNREKFYVKRITGNTSPVNNIVLENIFSQAFTRTATAEFHRSTFSAQKVLLGVDVVCKGANIHYHDGISIGLLNYVNLRYLSDLIFIQSSDTLEINRLQQLIFLRPPATNVLAINSERKINEVLVNDVLFAYHKLESLISLSPLNDNTRQKSLCFEHSSDITKHNIIFSDDGIAVNAVNGVSLDFFIHNRSKLSEQSDLTSAHQMVEGFITIENIILDGDDIRIDQINDVSCDDVVLTHSVKKQEVSGYKQIDGVFSTKPFHTWKINNAEFISFYSRALLKSHKQSFDKFVTKNGLKAEKELRILRSFNNISMF